MFLQSTQTTSNIWTYNFESRKCFLHNSVLSMKYIAMATFAPLHYQLTLKQCTPFWKPKRNRDRVDLLFVKFVL